MKNVMERKTYSKLSVALLTLIILSILPGVVTKFVAAESMMTDKPLYAIKWKDNALGYVNVTVTLTGLDPETRYEIAVFKFHGPVGLNYVRELYGVYEAEIKFTIPPTMDSRPEDITGTWNATLYKVVGETRTVVTWSNFGVWAINSKLLNYGRILQIWGGGFKPGTKVNFTVYEKTAPTNVITDELFGEDPAKSPVSSVVCVKYGTFSNTSDTITTEIPKSTYVVELKQFLFLPKVTSTGAPETTLEFTITDELIVNILKPEEGSKWRRTDTVPVEVEVLYQDLVPVTAGSVNVTFTPPDCGAGSEDNPKTISLSYNPASKTWVGSFKIQKNNSTGTWTVEAKAKDFYGNSGSDTNSITVRAAILVVTTEVAPPASVPRASWVSWLIKVTYKGDGSPAKLYLPLCTVYVVNATTEAIVGSAYLVEVEVGRYNVTWFVPADAPLGDYRFLIPADALKDTVTICTVRNTGPEKNVLSPIFAVGITALKVEVKTYSAKDTAKERVAFTPGSMVYIGAKVTYLESGVVMSAGSVRAYIYNKTGHLIAEIPMAYDSGTRMWWCEWDSTGYPAGRYRVLVKARDIGYNVGEGETYFYISGLIVSPSKGTVPPIENTKCEKLKDGNWLITATVYTDPVSGKKLGTVISITATHFTPNSKVNVTVDWLPYPAVAGKTILLAMNVPTDAEGNFATTVVFPTTIRGIYYIIARDAKGLEMKSTFEVVPGMILTPDPVVGSALTKVIATGLPGPVGDFTAAETWEILVNDTDAMRSLAGHIGFFSVTKWKTNANGTLVSVDLSPTYSYSVKPGFIMPFIEPGAYAFKLILEGGGYRNSTDPALFKAAKITSVSDSVKVVNAFKEFTVLVDKVDALVKLVSEMNVLLKSVDKNVATLVTDAGIIKADLSALKSLVEKMGGTLTEISGGIATIKTDVGKITASLDALSPKIEAVRGDVVKISTTVGEVLANLETIEPVVKGIKDGVATVSTKIDTLTGKVTTIDGNVATVRTDVGDIKARIADLAGVPGALTTVTTAVWIAVILSLVAAICSIVSLLQLRKRIAG